MPGLVILRRPRNSNLLLRTPHLDEEELVKDISLFSLAYTFDPAVKSCTLLMLLHADIHLPTKMWNSERRESKWTHFLMMSQL